MASTTEPQASSGVDTPKELSDPVPPYPSSEVISPNFNYPSFSKLLEGVVMAANSASSHQENPMVAEYSRLEGQFKMSHREALACVTAKATEAQVQTQIHLPTKAANSSDASPSIKPELIVPTSSTIEHRQSSSFPNNKINNTCHEDKKNLSDISQQQSLLHPEDTANDNKRSSLSHVSKPPSDVVKAPNSDGYSWRKYGQKQVKSPESSRSYYRCTHAGCSVKKKVQHCDQSGHIIKVDYKGHHNHDPPSQMPRINKGNSFKKQAMAVESGVKINADTSSQQKLGDVDKPSNGEECDAKMSLNSGSKSTMLYNSIESKGGDVEEEHQKTAAQNLRPEAKQLVSFTGDESSSLNDSNDQFTSDGAKERDAVSGQKRLIRPEAKQLVLFTGDESSRLNDSDVIMSDGAKERDVVSGQKKRIKERSKASTETPQRAPKQPKIVIHAPGDVGTISDGYRWRKYGQKMVKGNPHPRSYYRCTSAGCPVRKHVERAMDSATVVIATYEGKHDHDMPVPKKRSPSSLSSKTTTTASSLILAAKATNNVPLHQNEPTQPSSAPSTRRQVDGSGGNTSGENAELGAEKKMLESAQTLLSMGIELKSC